MKGLSCKSLPNEKPESRFTDIDSAKGLAIILVVLGHVVARKYPEGNAWFIYVKNTIYMFHMAFFMFLSGWIFYCIKPALTDLSFIFKRAYRLLIPFFLFAFIVIFGKSIASDFLFVDNSVYSIQDAITSIIWNTSESHATFIWYIYVLFFFNIISMSLVHSSKIHYILIFSFVLTLINPPQIMYLDYMFRYYFFFILGCFLFYRKDLYYGIIDKYSSLFIIIFFLLLIGINVAEKCNIAIPAKHLYFTAGLSSVPAIHSFIRMDFPKLKFLRNVGRYCLTIYLLNVIMIGMTKGILLHFISWNYSNFVIFLPVLFCAGIFLPIILWNRILSKIPIIKNITI